MQVWLYQTDALHWKIHFSIALIYKCLKWEYFLTKMLLFLLMLESRCINFAVFYKAEKKAYLFWTVHNHVCFRNRLITLSPVITINWSHYSECITDFAYLHRVLSLSVGTEWVGGLISKISHGAIKKTKWDLLFSTILRRDLGLNLLNTFSLTFVLNGNCMISAFSEWIKV